MDELELEKTARDAVTRIIVTSDIEMHDEVPHVTVVEKLMRAAWLDGFNFALAHKTA